MYLFIISEVMLFGAFFTAYFFMRVVKGSVAGARHRIPVLVAACNTAVLISSSFTMHWALVATKNGNRSALRAGLFATFFLGLTFLTVQINEYVHLGWAPARPRPGYDLLRPHRAARRARHRRPDPAAVREHPRQPRPLHPEEHRGVEVPGIYWHFVDVMWIVVFTALYII